jgi:hypothetical protein
LKDVQIFDQYSTPLLKDVQIFDQYSTPLLKDLQISIQYSLSHEQYSRVEFSIL